MPAAGGLQLQAQAGGRRGYRRRARRGEGRASNTVKLTYANVMKLTYPQKENNLTG